MPSHPDRVRRNYKFWAAYHNLTNEKLTPDFLTLKGLMGYLDEHTEITKNRFVFDEIVKIK